MHDSQATASMSLIESLTADNAALTREIAWLRARAQLDQAMLAHTASGIAARGLDGDILVANQAFYALSGYSADELQQAAEDSLFSLVRAQPAHSAATQHDYRHKDGRILSARLRATPVYDRDQSMRYTIVTVDDLGALQADQERQQWLLTCETILAGAPDGIIITTIDGVITYANLAFRTMMGYDELTVGMHLNSMIAPEERRFVPAVIQKLIQEGTWQGTRTYVRRDGSTFEANISLVLIRDDDGQPRSRAAVMRDMTKQRRVQQEQLLLQEQVIAAQQSQLRDLSAPVLRLAPGVIVVPLAGNIDSARTAEIIEALLSAIAKQHTTAAIIDIAGLAQLDGVLAQLLLRAAHAVRLLGAHVVVTSFQPHIAEALKQLGLEQLGVVMHSTLQDGVDYALKRQQRRDGG